MSAPTIEAVVRLTVYERGVLGHPDHTEVACRCESNDEEEITVFEVGCFNSEQLARVRESVVEQAVLAYWRARAKRGSG